LNPDAAARRVELDVRIEGRLVGTVAAARVEDAWVSGYGAPTGGVDFVRPDEPPAAVIELVRQILEHAAADGVRRLELRGKPPHHGAAEAHLHFVLLNLGAVVDLANLNFFVDVREPAACLQARAAKAARRAAALDWTVHDLALDDDAGWAAAHRLLEHNRVSKGRPMRLSSEYVRAVRDRFRPLVRMHVVRDAAGQDLAAALVYRTARRHDVVQYWGDLGGMSPSPMPLLARHVFESARRTGAIVVDLGVSTDDARPNHGLIQFKRSVGAHTEVRSELSIDVEAALASSRWERLRG
jgi:hypothetical protein